MKTAITVLQEMMVKLGETPEFECISQSGPNHQATFEYQCIACGVVVTATAHSKKEAKQNAARLMLHRLSLKGHLVPPPYGLPPEFPIQRPAGGGPEPLAVRSYVALLKELCETFLLPAVDYELIGDTGPPHLRHFTMRARMGLHERCATATTKKAARQTAAEQLYHYLRENMPRITADFDEKEALVRAHEKIRDRYVEATREDGSRRPDLSLKISEYHLGLFAQIDEEKRTATEHALEKNVDPHEAEGVLLEVGLILGLDIQFGLLECESGALCLVEVTGTSPPLAFAGADRAAAALHALRFARTALTFAAARD